MTSYATEGRALERARPAQARVRSVARRAALTALTRLPRARTSGLRIVHSHSVFDDERARFAEHVRFLAREFTPVSVSQAVERLRAGTVTGDEIVVTFDDGFRNQLANAAPILAEQGISACFFLVSELVGARPDAVTAFCRDRLHLGLPVEPLDWDGAARLLELGHEVGSHTRRHHDLTMLGPHEVAEELTASRDELQRRLGPVSHVSVPYGDRGRFTERIGDAARAAGYASCATAIRGRNRDVRDVYALHRDHLSARWPLREVAYFLA